jgi:tRNA dimethylallyltransferase
MTIGTAKPSEAELNEVKHHLIGHISIHQSYTAGDYEKEVISSLDKYFEKKEIAILCGGTGLYIKAVTEGLDQFPTVSTQIRTQVNLDLNEKGLPTLLNELKEKDPKYFNEVDPDNHRRVIRAIEVIRASGQPFSSFRKQTPVERSFHVKGKILVRERALLYERINDRVDKMLESGLLEEVRQLLRYQHLPALQTVGYQELFNYFNGLDSLDSAVAKIKQNSRRYAKRQLTWFRNQTDFPEILLE